MATLLNDLAQQMTWQVGNETVGWMPCDRHSDMIIAVARAIGCSDAETPALLTRIRAAAIVMNDTRWPAWPAQMMTATVEERQVFDALMLRLVAGLPLSAELTFDADAIFVHLLGSATPRGRA